MERQPHFDLSRFRLREAHGLCRSRMRYAAVVFLLLAGCGGEVRTGTPEVDGGGPGAEPGGGGGFSGTSLPGCRRGFKPDDQPSSTCDFLADGLCYESKVAACACVCPNRPNTNCTSGFPVPDGRVVVTCQ
jgi:hypothetical protein